MSVQLGDILKKNIFLSTQYEVTKLGFKTALVEFLTYKFTECIATGTFVTNGTIISSIAGAGSTPVVLEKVGTVSSFGVIPVTDLVWETNIRNPKFYFGLAKILESMISSTVMMVDLKLKGIISPFPIKLKLYTEAFATYAQNYMDSIRPTSSATYFYVMNKIGNAFWKYVSSVTNPVPYTGTSGVLSFTGTMVISFAKTV